MDGFGGTSGTISFDGDALSGLDDPHVSFYFGSPNQDDNWFSYSVDAAIDGEVDWTNAGNWRDGQWGLSNVATWSDDPSEVPAPGILGLLGAGALGLVAVAGRRRRHG